MTEITEIRTNIISEGTRIEGSITLDHISRVHGVLNGDLNGNPGSTVILGETAVIEGNIHADTLIIDGFVRGDIQAKSKVVISGTGRVIGNVRSPSFIMHFGGYFEGKCQMDDSDVNRDRAE